MNDRQCCLSNPGPLGQGGETSGTPAGSGRRPAWRLIFGLVAGLVLAAGLQAQEAPSRASTNNPQTQILTTRGEVSVWLGSAKAWQPATVGQVLRPGDRLRTERASQASLRLFDLSALRVNELTTFELKEPRQKDKKPLLDLKSGSLYFFSREKPADVEFNTPVAAGAIRGTEFHLAVLDNGEASLALVDGAVELQNDQGTLQVSGGELARVVPGQAPTKTALIDAISIIQWVFLRKTAY